MPNNSIYAIPQKVTDIKECGFYHTMDIPGYGVVKGLFDLRQGAREYLGNVDFNGKRVLELGTASGFLCFHMESKGAEVVSYDLSENDLWDIVPHFKNDYEKCVAERKKSAKRLNNAYWFTHEALNSKARLVNGTVYAIPREIGMVDISTFGAILLHVRDPFLALQNALRLTRETVIITEGAGSYLLRKMRLPNLPYMEFVPTTRAVGYSDTWWKLSPSVLRRMIAILGFEDVNVSYHWQKYMNHKVRFLTIVGRRTREYYDY